LTVVGIVGDVRNGGFEQPVGSLAYYVPRTQAPAWWYEGLVVRTRSDPEHSVPALRGIVQRVLPEAPIIETPTAYDTISGANARVRFATFLMAAFATIALAVALIGIYGTFWCAVRQRTREIGVRIALGATEERVLRTMLAAGARLALAGVLVGLALALVAGRALESWLLGVSGNDPITLVLVAAFLAMAALAAMYLPARHATRIDPVEALRQD
jgi:ABC-type antimicrobial peptide transport system permease subunit